MNTAAIILAAGESSRFRQAGFTEKKQFLKLQGVPLFWRSAICFARNPGISSLVFVFSPTELAARQQQINELNTTRPLGIAIHCTAGGKTRQESVHNGLSALPPQTDIVLVHDGARPFLQAALVSRLLQELKGNSDIDGVIPALAVTDTIKEVENGIVQKTLERKILQSVQTPQAFFVPVLRAAHEKAANEKHSGTDDAALVELAGGRVKVICGDPMNKKITTPDDLALLAENPTPPRPCTGFGYDVHKFGGDRPLVLGGIPISGDLKVAAHSDGDVVLHALTDALLSCCGLGDIGDLFPDTDKQFENMSSSIFVAKALEIFQKNNFILCHTDITIITQIPKISPYKKMICQNIAKLLHLEEKYINIKATTEEGLGFTGNKEGIKSIAVVTALQNQHKYNEVNNAFF